MTSTESKQLPCIFKLSMQAPSLSKSFHTLKSTSKNHAPTKPYNCKTTIMRLQNHITIRPHANRIKLFERVNRKFKYGPRFPPFCTVSNTKQNKMSPISKCKLCNIILNQVHMHIQGLLQHFCPLSLRILFDLSAYMNNDDTNHCIYNHVLQEI